MKYIDVQSSNIKKIGYDEQTHILEIVFDNKKHLANHYAYADVPPEVYAEMLQAESIGGYFQDHIKLNYVTTKLEQWDG